VNWRQLPFWRDTLVHIVGVERGWLTCWKEPSPSSTFVRLLDTAQRLFNPNAFPDLLRCS